jgi:hypothetical protein
MSLDPVRPQALTVARRRPGAFGAHCGAPPAGAGGGASSQSERHKATGDGTGVT